ncbi:TonB dependent receptor [Pedobacter sp. GR22-6]|uniref:TonB dependent receptor n=1 Tax=Pedobacter sp. GR22-6 TaxID=3127957 RepID=UPI00307E834F
MKYLLLTLSLCGIISGAFAQNGYTIKGKITDTAGTHQMLNTTIALLNEKDSTLVGHTRADAESNFSITKLRAGKFILLVTYPGYADYAENFELDSLHPAKDFGNINLFLKAALLNDVIIKGKAVAIRIKGDTTEYNAGSYDIRPNDKVEDLLKQLPGIQVDKNGKITAQGQTINKVLVDGEEFFGDDPTLVTRNLRSDMIDKVQLYDKKSDQATFTGIDDGQKEKTINLKLKEDKKQGYFGTLAAGAGTDKFYEARATANIFKNKQKMAFVGGSGNTGQSGFGSGQRIQIGGDDMASGEGLENFNGGYNGRGIPSSHTGGFHFEDAWNANKRAINTNLKLGSSGVKGNNNTLSRNTLPTGVINSESDEDFDNIMLQKNVDARYKHEFDSTSTITLTVSGGLANSKTRSDFKSTNTRGDNSLMNTGIRNINNEGDEKTLNASAFWAKKLKKKGRTISINVRQSLGDSRSDGYLYALNEFYDVSSQKENQDLVDQYKVNSTIRNSFSSNATYTEPLSKTLALTANYGLNLNNSNSNRRSFNQSPTGKYDDLDENFSNHFKLDEISNQAGASINFNKGKTGLTAGTQIQAVRFNQVDVNANKSYRRNFINWFPQANYRLKISQQQGLSLGYNGSTSQPSLEQIQPIRENTDPLNVILGNPDLRPSFSNNLNLSYSSFKMLSEQYFYVQASYNNTFNQITNNTVTDPTTGKSSNQAVNISNKNPDGLTVQAMLSRKIKSLDAHGGIEFTFMSSNSYGMINNTLNESKFLDIYGNLSLAKYKSGAYSFRFGAGPACTVLSNSLQGTRSQNWGVDASGNFSVNLPGKIEIGSDAVYAYKTKTEAFDRNLNRFNWNASISKKFLKAENLRLSLRGNDLLNQNKGFNQSINGNMIVQNRFSNINRYFLGSIIWDFNKMGAATKTQ